MEAQMLRQTDGSLLNHIRGNGTSSTTASTLQPQNHPSAPAATIAIAGDVVLNWDLEFRSPNGRQVRSPGEAKTRKCRQEGGAALLSALVRSTVDPRVKVFVPPELDEEDRFYQTWR